MGESRPRHPRNRAVPGAPGEPLRIDSGEQGLRQPQSELEQDERGEEAEAVVDRTRASRVDRNG